jgi:hypothetical protein
VLGQFSQQSFAQIEQDKTNPFSTVAQRRPLTLAHPLFASIISA